MIPKRTAICCLHQNRCISVIFHQTEISPYEAYHIFDMKTLTGFVSIKTVGLAASICSSSPLHAMPEFDHLAHVFTVIERL